jgi:hypothetical protein
VKLADEPTDPNDNLGWRADHFAQTTPDEVETNDNRLLVAFCLWPVVAAVVMFFTSLALGATGTWIFAGTPSVPAALALGFGTGLLAIPLTPLGALVVMWLRQRGPLTLGPLLFAGMAIGNVPAAIMILLALFTAPSPNSLLNPSTIIRAIVMGVWLGMALGFVLWALAGVQSGEQDSKSPTGNTHSNKARY